MQLTNTIGSNQQTEGYTDVDFTTTIEEEDETTNKIKKTTTFKIDNEEVDLDDI